MRKVARDVFVHHVPVSLTNVVTDVAAPIMTNEDELFSAELLCQVCNVICEYVDRVVLYPRRLVRFTVTPIIDCHTPDRRAINKCIEEGTGEEATKLTHL